jgi:membrane-associated HD superfamily phosphohydrolase
MRTSLIVDRENQLLEVRKPYFPKQPVVVRVIAKIISWIFHPVFTPVMVIWFLVYIHPYLFIGVPAPVKGIPIFGAAVVAYTLFPLVTVFLLKGLNFIDNIYLRTQKERIIPFVACMIWYFWISYVWYNFGKTRNGIDLPHEAIQFAMATFFSTVIGLMVNIRMKVSLHAISMGIAATFFAMMAFNQDLNFGVYFSIVLLITGVVCTARFIVSDHTPSEVYTGLAVGIISMLVALKIEQWLGD